MFVKSIFIFFPQKLFCFVFFLLPCTYTQTHYKNLIHNIKGRAITIHVNIFLRVIHFLKVMNKPPDVQ